MKSAAIGMIGLLMLAGGLSAHNTPSFSVRNDETFTGKIMDSSCAEDGHHIGVIKNGVFKNEKSCILTCVKFGGAQFVLYNSETRRIYKLDDQQQPEVFAGQDVTITGSYDEEAKTIHVISIRPKIS